MKKLFLTVALIFSILNFGTANAEHSKANEYRQIFQSGNFYVRFKDKWGDRILAAENGARMERMSYKYERSNMAWLNPLGALFGGGENKNPEVMYKDGKYFQFIGKNKANFCDENDINFENINPSSGWDKVQKKLALPDELAVFFWNDPFNTKNSQIPAPTFQESYKKIIKVNRKDIECDCDLYACELNGAKNSGVLYYELAYNPEGDLVIAKTYIKRNDQEYDLNVLEVVKIQSEIPVEDKFQIDEANIQCYAPRMGDMADLLEESKIEGSMKDVLKKQNPIEKPNTVESTEEESL